MTKTRAAQTWDHVKRASIKVAPPEWVEQLKQSAALLGEAQVAVLRHFGEKAGQWNRLYSIRIQLGQEMERLKRVLEKAEEV